LRDPTLRVGLLNLMPDMVTTEMQFARLLGATRRHVELVPAVPASYRIGHKSTGAYARWDETSLPRGLNGLIVTGAPLEHIPFDKVRYWRELACIFDWAASNVGSTLYICWAAFAALGIFHGVRSRVLPHKISGVFQQQVLRTADPLTNGLGTDFPCPVSRYTEVFDLPWGRGLACLAKSSESGLCLVADGPRNAHYMFNHLEYDADTLDLEYQRDHARRLDAGVRQNNLPNGMTWKSRPAWRGPAEKLFANWLGLLSAHAHQAADFGRTAA
jgi:homoserine O-succinyltransferase